jgi:hypothetical protein
MAVKRAVLDENVDGRRTLWKEIRTEFARDNGSSRMDFTTMKVSGSVRSTLGRKTSHW